MYTGYGFMKFFRIIVIGAALFLFHDNAQAAGLPSENIQISQKGDLDMSCHGISKEMSVMEEIAARTQEIRDDSKITNTGISVGKAVGSYLVGSLVGGIGIIAAGYFVNEAASDYTEDAVSLQTTAIQRHSFMAGIYNAKGCAGPVRMALIEPAAGDAEIAETYELATDHPLVPRYSYND